MKYSAVYSPCSSVVAMSSAIALQTPLDEVVGSPARVRAHVEDALTGQERDRREQLVHRARLHVPVPMLQIRQPAHQLAVPAFCAHLLGESLQARGLGEDVLRRIVQQLDHTAVHGELALTGLATQPALAYLALVAFIDAQRQRVVAATGRAAQLLDEPRLHDPPNGELRRSHSARNGSMILQWSVPDCSTNPRRARRGIAFLAVVWAPRP